MVRRPQCSRSRDILRRVSIIYFYAFGPISNTNPRDALSNAKPVPGGFLCASDKEAADQLFLDLTLNGAIIWADTADTTL